MHRDSVAYEFGPFGEVKKLVPVIGLGVPNQIVWQDGNSQPCDPPDHIAQAWATLSTWIKAHTPDQPPIG